MYLPRPSAGGDFKPAPTGTHRALCVGVIDLGTQTTNFQNKDGSPKTAHQIRLTWQLCDEFMDDGRPFALSKDYTFSTHEKATFRKDLEAWRGKKFEEADFGPGGFEPKNLLNKGCLLTVVHTDKGDKTYANVAGVSGMPKGMGKPQEIADPIYLSLDLGEFNQQTFEGLSDYLKDRIRKAPEYAAILEARAPKSTPRAVGNGHAAGPPPTSYDEDMSDEIPF